MFRGYKQYGVGVVTGDDGYIYAAVVFFTPYRDAATPASRVAVIQKPQGQSPQTIEMLVRLVSLDAGAA